MYADDRRTGVSISNIWIRIETFENLIVEILMMVSEVNSQNITLLNDFFKQILQSIPIPPSKFLRKLPRFHGLTRFLIQFERDNSSHFVPAEWFL